MFTQRLVQQSLRRVTSKHPSSLSSRPSLLKLAAPSAIATSSHVQLRPATSQSAVPQEEGLTPLEAQRLNRPVSPHIAIYRPQVTWYLSALNRITGVVLSGGMYVFASAYLVAPLMGWHLESASMAAAFAAWPAALKVATKMTLALPFTFHTMNGVRHLIWDFGMGITNKKVIQTGWTVVGLSVTSAALLAFM